MQTTAILDDAWWRRHAVVVYSSVVPCGAATLNAQSCTSPCKPQGDHRITESAWEEGEASRRQVAMLRTGYALTAGYLGERTIPQPDQGPADRSHLHSAETAWCHPGDVRVARDPEGTDVADRRDHRQRAHSPSSRGQAAPAALHHLAAHQPHEGVLRCGDLNTGPGITYLQCGEPRRRASQSR